MPSARSGRAIATIDATAPARAAQRFGANIIEAGDRFFAAVDDVESKEAKRRAREFAWEEKLALEEQMRQTQPGQASGFHDRWVEGYKERASAFLAGVPERYKPDIDAELFEVEKSLFSSAATFARNEQKRVAVNAIDEYKGRLALSPDLEAARESFAKYVDDSPWLTPIEKDERRRKGLADLESINVQHRLNAGEKYDDILRDITDKRSPAANLRASRGESVGGLFQAPGLEIEPAINSEAPYMGRPRSEKNIKRIIVHGDLSEDVNALVQYGQRVDPERGFDPNYHFYIARDGRIIQGVPLDRRANHTLNENSDSIGIVIAGADAGRMPTPEQEAAAKRLISSLGKTYDIDPQNVMGHGELQPGRRDRREGGNVAADIRKNGFAPDDVNEVTEVRVADAEGETATAIALHVRRNHDAERTPGARLPGPPRYSNLSAEQRLRLANHVMSQRDQQRRKTLVEIGKAEDLAAEGLPPDDELVGKIMAGIERAGGDEVVKAWEEVADTWRWTTTLRQARPEEVESAVIDLRRKLQSGGASKTDARRLQVGERLLDNMRSELNSNPLGWAARVGKIDLQEMDFSDQETASAIFAERIQQAEDTARFYGLKKPTYLTPNERSRLTGIMEQGGDQMLAIAGMVRSVAGTRALPIFAEISKDAPTVAMLGGLVVTTGTQNPVVRDAAEGIDLSRQEGFQSMAPTPRDSITEATAVLGTALDGNLKTREAAIQLANAAYEIRARRAHATTFDTDLWRQTLREVMGEREIGGEVYGGIVAQSGWFSGSDHIVLPPNLKQDDWRDAVTMITQEDLDEAGLGRPVGATGRPIGLDRVKGGTLVQVGNGRYLVALGDPSTPGAEQFVGAFHGFPDEEAPSDIERPDRGMFVLDFNRLAPLLARRRPDLFIGVAQP